MPSAEAPIFVPGTKAPTSPQWFSTFILTTYPGDPSGVVPKAYEVSGPAWVLGNEETVRTFGMAGKAFMAVDLDDEIDARTGEVLLAGLAPPYHESVTSSAYLSTTFLPCPPCWEPSGVRFYARTSRGSQRMLSLHQICRSRIQSAGDDAENGALLLLSALNRQFGVFETGDWKVLRGDIAAVQEKVEKERKERGMKERERKERERKERERKERERFSGVEERKYRDLYQGSVPERARKVRGDHTENGLGAQSLCVGFLEPQ